MIEPIEDRAKGIIELLNEQIDDREQRYEDLSEEDKEDIGISMRLSQIMAKGQRAALIEYIKTP